MKNLSLLALLCVLGLSACGRSTENGPEPVQDDPNPPITNVPESLKLTGSWSPAPHFQVRDFGTSKMVQLQGKGRVAELPRVDRLSTMMDLESAAQVEFVSPALGDCVLSQATFDSTMSDGLFVEFSLWGWDKGGSKACQMFLEVGRQTGFQAVLHQVPVQKSTALPRVEIVLGP